MILRYVIFYHWIGFHHGFASNVDPHHVTYVICKQITSSEDNVVEVTKVCDFLSSI